MKKETTLLWIAYFLVITNCFSCSSSEKTKDENDIIKKDSIKYSEYIPPGTASIKAEIIKIREETDYNVADLKILEVLEYGVSVSPLPPGKELEVTVSKNLLQEKNIKPGEVIFGRIFQTRSTDTEYWELIMFNK